MNKKTLHKQQGIALIVSLIFLVMITIIGVSSIRGTTMNEMMSSNSQQKIITFQVAESVIEGVWDTGFILEKTPVALVNPPAEKIFTDSSDKNFNQELSPPAKDGSPAVAIGAYASLQYCGEDSSQLGSQISVAIDKPAFVAQIYNIQGHGKIVATNTASNHEQRGYIVRPATGRTGNCP